MMAKTTARLVARGFSLVQDVDTSERLHQPRRQRQQKILAAVANEQGLTIFHVDLAQAIAYSNFDAEIEFKLIDGCGDMPGKLVRLNRSP